MKKELDEDFEGPKHCKEVLAYCGIGLVASLARSIGSELSYSYDKGTIAKITLTETADKPIFA